MKKLIRFFVKPIYMLFFKMKWKMKNRHNTTYAKSRFMINNVKVGKATYGPVEILYDTGKSKLHIGNYCSIAANVKFFLGGVHDYKRISLWPFQTFIYGGYDGRHNDNTSFDITIEDDCWIGYDSIVLPGAYVGKGSVIGARSIVTGYIPPYSVYVHNKVIKSRFSDEIIDKIKYIDYNKISHKKGDLYESFCTEQLSIDNVDNVIDAFIS